MNLETPLKKHDVGCVILSPTRELASQTHSILKLFLDSTNLTSLLMLG